jgi:hypothetical protein
MAEQESTLIPINADTIVESAIEQEHKPPVIASDALTSFVPLHATPQFPMSGVERGGTTPSKGGDKGSSKGPMRKPGSGEKSFSSGGGIGSRVGKKRPHKGMELKGIGIREPSSHKRNKKKTTKKGSQKRGPRK